MDDSASPPRPAALVVGGAGVLGAALLAEALAAGRFARVAALVRAPLASAMRDFEPLPLARLERGPEPLGFELAFVVFERPRRGNRCDEAFWQPPPEALPALAEALHARGVRRLVVVVPHAPALLPQALRYGFASHAERAVGALGFEQLVFLRSAAPAQGGRDGPPLERLVAWWLGQLRWMIPQAQQPVRAVRVAAIAVALARLLPAASPGVRVVPPETLWAWAQAPDAAAAQRAWLRID
jgi:hypothetical protein